MSSTFDTDRPSEDLESRSRVAVSPAVAPVLFTPYDTRPCPQLFASKWRGRGE
jgi:hypothetical protein